MKFVADLHLHSKYSRAVSQQMVLAQMVHWAKLKGINVLATGDFTHPFWFDQIKNELAEAGRGLYKLKPSVNGSQIRQNSEVSVNREPVYFLLSTEISSIYSQGDRVRRIHNLFFFPSLASVEKFNKALLMRGANLRSDGRPIVGITSRDLAEIALLCDEKALVIPAHVWTPWFSVFGSFSGFDSVEECFGDMSKFVYGIETGLSSDPAMNWRIADLDNLSILSFSDAHSLEKMGREVTVFEAGETSYNSIYWAIRNVGWLDGGPKRENEPTNLQAQEPTNQSKIAFTIEFYPEEGKYHFTGHRNCNFSQSPEETAKNGDICPVCGKPLTVGVMHRVEQLKTRNLKHETRDINGVRWVYPEGDGRPPYVSMVPLGEILAGSLGAAVGTKKVADQYLILVSNLGSEFNVLLKADLEAIARFSNQKVARAVSKVRGGDIVVEPGYDGKFGVVKIFNEKSGELTKGKINDDAQLNLFA
ncbi:hypothetical protein A3E71_04625 [Candidatus Curtissbacteria bacterium RIFCSPHIGHO2_12_FULL_42_33]|nr:MAG: hypothetical protein A3E71_04625 [Candidatus Curtissbacteria bacterium RIFCSPHIGHO2_12_FULL_42_33]